ncbi:hypothetical protein ONZ51_g4816 [Trametes cubensis]|uniref:Uncharacterized protein n=1 Tax=Trametes cubensis TaxID=1111947 RepID=A0AAD7TV34_9APHY|nr:hypothetical protein ONZ51_g4816 [Trametes cubensis]
MSIGVAYKNSRRTLEYDIMPIVVEQWHNRANWTVFCPIEVEIESVLEENQEMIMRWLDDGKIDHPAITEGGKLNAVVAMFMQMFVQLRDSGAPAGMLMGLNTVYLCQLQGDTMLIDGPRYRYHMLNPSSGIGAPFSPHDMFSFIVTCFYVMGARRLHAMTASRVPDLRPHESYEEPWWAAMRY